MHLLGTAAFCNLTSKSNQESHETAHCSHIFVSHKYHYINQADDRLQRVKPFQQNASNFQHIP